MATKSKKLELAAGLYFVAKIKGNQTAGVVQKENSDFYLCQNTHDGSPCTHKYGYDYAWIIFRGTPDDLKSDAIQVTDLELFKRKPKGFDIPTKLSVAQLAKKDFIKWQKNITLAGYDVIFTRTGIKVGCTDIKAKEVMFVAKRMQAEMKRFLAADKKRKRITKEVEKKKN